MNSINSVQVTDFDGQRHRHKNASKYGNKTDIRSYQRRSRYAAVTAQTSLTSGLLIPQRFITSDWSRSFRTDDSSDFRRTRDEATKAYTTGYVAVRSDKALLGRRNSSVGKYNHRSMGRSGR